MEKIKKDRPKKLKKKVVERIRKWQSLREKVSKQWDNELSSTGEISAQRSK